jgi:hypothetical protein
MDRPIDERLGPHVVAKHLPSFLKLFVGREHVEACSYRGVIQDEIDGAKVVAGARRQTCRGKLDKLSVSTIWVLSERRAAVFSFVALKKGVDREDFSAWTNK